VSAATQPQVKFVPSFTPEPIALKFTEGKPVNSNFNGPQVMFTLTDGRKWFTEPYVQQKITDMRLAPGEVFEVAKQQTQRGNQRITTIEITAVVLPEPIPVQSSESASATHLARCYRDAIDVAAAAVEYGRTKGIPISPDFSDIRALAATICINETGRRAA
jgi:hypothetical protein